jgi:hypothetical protein
MHPRFLWESLRVKRHREERVGGWGNGQRSCGADWDVETQDIQPMDDWVARKARVYLWFRGRFYRSSNAGKRSSYGLS